MQYLFDDYKALILDASFFTTLFSEDEKDGLRNSRVYVAETYDTEKQQVQKLLTATYRNHYEANLRFLDSAIKPCSIETKQDDSDDQGTEEGLFQKDIWGLLHRMTIGNPEGSVVVVTANQLLIERIIVNSLQTDIYNLNSHSFIPASEFSLYKSQVEIFENNRILHPAPDFLTGSSRALYKEDKGTVVLGEEINNGLEAGIYRIKGKTDYIAKIFHDGNLSEGKYNNIKKIAGFDRKHFTEWAVFPHALLYSDPECTMPVGFLEKYIRTGDTLENNPLFTGNVFDIPEEYLSKKRSYILEICLKIVRQVYYLNICGFFISDFNITNFADASYSNYSLQMWDTDSFGYGTYFGKYFSQHYADREIHNTINENTKERVIQLCNDALYQFVFYLISLGDAPISEFNYQFKYSAASYPLLYRKYYFPVNIWKHMEKVFSGEKEPSVEGLMKELADACTQLKNHSEYNSSIKDLLCDTTPEFSEFAKLISSKPMAETKSDQLPSSKSGNESHREVVVEDETYRRKRRRNGVSKLSLIDNIFSVIICLVLLFFLILLLTMTQSGKKNKTDNAVSGSSESSASSSILTVPDKDSYVGWPEADARKKLEQDGWIVQTDEIFLGNMRKGYVGKLEPDPDNGTVLLFVNQGPDTSDIVQTNAEITSNYEGEITLYPGESKKITLTASPERPVDFRFTAGSYPSIDVSWGDWIDQSSMDVTLTAQSASEGYVRFYIEDLEYNDKVCYTDLYVVVKE